MCMITHSCIIYKFEVLNFASVTSLTLESTRDTHFRRLEHYIIFFKSHLNHLTLPPGIHKTHGMTQEHLLLVIKH